MTTPPVLETSRLVLRPYEEGDFDALHALYAQPEVARWLYYEAATRMLFKQRYKPTSNFSSQNLNTYQMLGCFGNGIIHIDQLKNATGSIGMRYKSLPLGEIRSAPKTA